MTEDKDRAIRPRTTLRSTCIIMTCTTAMIVNSSNNTSVSIALPTIGRDMNIPAQKLQWIVGAYALSSGCLLLMFGRVADVYGRKLVFLAGTAFMAAFSLGCALAQDRITLDILRAFQGVGAAATIPSAIGILAHAFPPSTSWRAIAFSCFAAGAPVGAALGMVSGGALVQYTAASWRSIFYMSAGLTALCLLFGMIAIDKDERSTETDRRVDWIGAFLVTSALILMVFALSEGEIARHGWATGYIIATLVVGVLLLAMFIAWQYYLERVIVDTLLPGEHKEIAENVYPHAPARTITAPAWLSGVNPPPLMKLSLWARGKGRFAATMAVALLLWGSFLSWIFWIMLYYQDFLHLSPINTMVRMVPMFVTGVLCNVLVATLVGRVSLWYLIAIGTTATSIAPLLLATVRPEATYWRFGFPAAILSVFGADFVYSAGTLYAAKLALPHEQSIAGATFQTMAQLGTALGLATTTIVYNTVLASESRKVVFPSIVASSSVSTFGGDGGGSRGPWTSDHVEEQLLSARLAAYQAAQWAAFGLGMLATVIGVISFRGVGIVGHPPTEKRGVEEEADGSETQTTNSTLETDS